jgi:ATP-binding cassette subfamily B protein
MLISRPNATDDEIREVLKTACADEFVSDLDAAVVKDGANFSGGQKQRLCIARALLKDSRVYIFDDSFSALDFKTESEVRQGMNGKLKDAVTVIVAQRISTVRDADIIAVLDGGKLSGLGTHDELKLSCKVYKEIIASQFIIDSKESKPGEEAA